MNINVARRDAAQVVESLEGWDKAIDTELTEIALCDQSERAGMLQNLQRRYAQDLQKHAQSLAMAAIRLKAGS